MSTILQRIISIVFDLGGCCLLSSCIERLVTLDDLDPWRGLPSGAWLGWVLMDVWQACFLFVFFVACWGLSLGVRKMIEMRSYIVIFWYLEYCDCKQTPLTHSETCHFYSVACFYFCSRKRNEAQYSPRYVILYCYSGPSSLATYPILNFIVVSSVRKFCRVMNIWIRKVGAWERPTRRDAFSRLPERFPPLHACEAQLPWLRLTEEGKILLRTLWHWHACSSDPFVALVEQSLPGTWLNHVPMPSLCDIMPPYCLRTNVQSGTTIAVVNVIEGQWVWTSLTEVSKTLIQPGTRWKVSHQVYLVLN